MYTIVQTKQEYSKQFDKVSAAKLECAHWVIPTDSLLNVCAGISWNQKKKKTRIHYRRKIWFTKCALESVGTTKKNEWNEILHLHVFSFLYVFGLIFTAVVCVYMYACMYMRIGVYTYICIYVTWEFAPIGGSESFSAQTYIHEYMQQRLLDHFWFKFIYIYIYMCVCVCVSVSV
jgi:hypothetical protein